MIQHTNPDKKLKFMTGNLQNPTRILDLCRKMSKIGQNFKFNPEKAKIRQEIEIYVGKTAKPDKKMTFMSETNQTYKN